MGAVLQQRVNNALQPLAFFSKKMNPTQQKYSAYDRELLAVYEAVKHFRHMLEARHFTVFRKPLVIGTPHSAQKGQLLASKQVHVVLLTELSLLVRVRVTLRLTVCQSARLGVEPTLGLTTRCYFPLEV
jgi:hypothetical protein